MGVKECFLRGYNRYWNKKAVYWYRKSAEQGDADAQKALEELEK